ncbi:MAG TPA: isoaspartyl peptidase/L-asparaginase, partial [Nitrospira sp.]|nr:isoaspartyl peptidase/L-asparaginase [Nitrospira sp.]
MTRPRPLILAHGGAGRWALTSRQQSCLAEALDTGHAVLRHDGPALVAVERTIRILEASGLFNAGRGSKRQLDGIQRMDASVMEGAALRAGAVASLEGFLHPITAARLVMEQTRHVLLAGPMAGRFARRFRLERHRPPALRRRSYERIFSLMKPGRRSHGTVGAVALDRSGTVAAGASTGGIDAMLPGRIGDTPLIGCGVYADNRTGAVSMTGEGEGIIRLAVAKAICERLAAGDSPKR